MNRMMSTAVALVFTLGLQAQGAPLDIQAKFVKVLLSSTGQFGFACNEPGLKARLEAMGVSVGPGFKLAWGSTEPEVRALKAQGRFILCPNPDWLKAGASLAILDDGGRPELFMDPANVKASGIVLPDAIAHLARRD